MLKFTQAQAFLDDAQRFIYERLTSGDQDHIQLAREMLDLLRGASPRWEALAITDDVKRWINQAPNDLSTKGLVYMEGRTGLRQRAWDLGSTPTGMKDWKVQGQTARALFYSGRFREAKRQFKRARKLLDQLNGNQGIPSLPDDERAEAWNIVAARAEFRVYMGFPDAAQQDILSIPDNGDRLGWHEWVRAFALHQLAFLDLHSPFGSAANDVMGNEQRYTDSINLLTSIQSLLSSNEQIDSQLLTAANYGAILRQNPGNQAALQGITSAMQAFRSAPHDTSSNYAWSWFKERRGRLPIINVKSDPVQNDPAVRVWRYMYGEHYHQNLVPACIPDSVPATDGQLDPTDDHADDPEDP